MMDVGIIVVRSDVAEASSRAWATEPSRYL
jgi:hypothetical protein